MVLVLIKQVAYSTYDDTERPLQGDNEVNPNKYGADVISMRKTREGYLLVELAKGAKSKAAVTRLGDAITKKPGDRYKEWFSWDS